MGACAGENLRKAPFSFYRKLRPAAGGESCKQDSISYNRKFAFQTDGFGV